MAQHNQLGKEGENIACKYLQEQGYIIQHQNWRISHYEIDIVCIKDNTLIIVEVKTRSNTEYQPSDLLSNKKQTYLIRAANAYIGKYSITMEVRFDLIIICPTSKTIEHIPDAILSF